MQSIQPKNLSDEEILRQVYLMGNEMLPKEWVEVLCERFAKALDWYQTDTMKALLTAVATA
jgi:hypothetical protein